MSIFQKVRSLFGLKSEVEESPVDILKGIIDEHESVQEELNKSQREYDALDQEYSLKIQACDKLIEKGSGEALANKEILLEKLAVVTDTYLKNVEEFVAREADLRAKRQTQETDIITKAIEVTALLTNEDQLQLKDIISNWEETGLVKGEEVSSQVLAIDRALEIVMSESLEKGGFGSGRRIINIGKHAYSVDKEHKLDGKDGHEHIRLLASGTSTNGKQTYKVHVKQNGQYVEAYEGTDATTAHETYDSIHKIHGEIEKAESDNDMTGHYANVLIKKDGKILFLKRAAKKVIAPNQYCLPGGHIEEGETIQQAAARELKEEAALDCDAGCMYMIGKAKCADGKWAFYLGCTPHEGEVMLLDGESVNACWMSEEEWMKEDLIFDLKDHLKELVGNTLEVSEIRDISKASDEELLEWAGSEEDEPYELPEQDDDLEKADKKKEKPKKKLSVEQLKAHSENTSSGQLKKAHKGHKDPSVRDAAKRELERRASEKEKKQEKVDAQQVKHIEKRLSDIEKRRNQIMKKLQDPNGPNAESLEREFISLGKEYRKLSDQLEKIDA